MDSNSKKAYLKLDLSDQDLEGLSTVHLKDTYCSNPDCSCGGAILYPSRLAGTGLDPWIELAKEIQFIVNVQTGEIQAKGPVSSLRQALQDCLHRCLDKRRLTQLRKRRQEVLRQHCEDGWNYRDWSDFEPGCMMGWADIFPQTLAPSILTPHGTCFLDDYYCCTFGCDCTEVQLAIISAGSASEVLGSATLDTKTSRVTFEPEPGFPQKVLQEVFDGFFEQHPDLRAELRRRGEFMAGPVATYVNESVAHPESVPPRVVPDRSLHRPPLWLRLLQSRLPKWVATNRVHAGAVANTRNAAWRSPLRGPRVDFHEIQRVARKRRSWPAALPQVRGLALRALLGQRCGSACDGSKPAGEREHPSW